jgi:hypothetical protein
MAALCVAVAMTVAGPAVCQEAVDASASDLRPVPLVELPDLKSDTPRFARLVARPDYDAAMWVVLDESGGTGSGHDRLYCDFNYDGRFGDDEVAQARKTHQRAPGPIFLFYPPFEVPPPDAEATELARPHLQMRYIRTGDGPAITPLSISLTMKRDAEQWQYQLSSMLKTGPSPEKAPLTRFDGEPRLEVVVRRGEQAGVIKLGVNTYIGRATLNDYKCDGATGRVEMTVRDAQGAIRDQTAGALDKFCFG